MRGLSSELMVSLHPCHLVPSSEQDWNVDLGIARQVLIRGFARTSEFKWKANRQVRDSWFH